MIYILLILTVSRSAWLGALGVTFIFLFSLWTQLKISPKNWNWINTIIIKIGIISALAISLVIVYFFNLTTFQLGNRVESTGTGLQKITISCENGAGDWKAVSIAEPFIIENIDELDEYHCQHINLEDIDKETAKGRFITIALRNDPNVSIRSEIYKKSWELIKTHPVLGIGWGNISAYLGADARGAGLNASNIFLEVWLGSGILGLLAFISLLAIILIRSLHKFLSDNSESKSIGMFLLLGFFAILIPNLFNGGIMLGYLWLFLGASCINNEIIPK